MACVIPCQWPVMATFCMESASSTGFSITAQNNMFQLNYQIFCKHSRGIWLKTTERIFQCPEGSVWSPWVPGAEVYQRGSLGELEFAHVQKICHLYQIAHHIDQRLRLSTYLTLSWTETSLACPPCSPMPPASTTTSTTWTQSKSNQAKMTKEIERICDWR